MKSYNQCTYLFTRRTNEFSLVTLGHQAMTLVTLTFNGKFRFIPIRFEPTLH